MLQSIVDAGGLWSVPAFMVPDDLDEDLVDDDAQDCHAREALCSHEYRVMRAALDLTSTVSAAARRTAAHRRC
jgi:hypothetical protein